MNIDMAALHAIVVERGISFDDLLEDVKAAVPAETRFRTKPQIVLNLIRQVMEQGVPPSIVLADAGYGNETVFRDQVTALGLVDAVGISPATSVWTPGTAPLPAKQWTGNGRPPKLPAS